MSTKTYSYEQYLDLLADPGRMKMHEAADEIIKRFREPVNIPSRFAPALYLLDYTTKKYLYVDNGVNGVFGYGPEYLYEIGLYGVISSWHPADLKVINEHIFPDNLTFLKTLPLNKYGDIVFTHNYRMKNVRDEYVMVLQRYSYIPSETPGMPYGVIGIVIDISHFKKDPTIIHTIQESVKEKGRWVDELLFKKVHPVFEKEPEHFLTPREIELLHYLSDGLSSKQIAQEMKISINTVNNHRKNMLEKTGSKTSVELLKYAMKHGLI